MKMTSLFLTFLLIAVSACNPTSPEPLPTVINLPTQPEAISLAITETPSPTPIPTESATLSPSPTIALSATLTITPSLTITNTHTPVPTETPLPTFEPGPLDEWGEEFFETVTVLPPVINGTPGYITTYGFVPTLFATNPFGTPIGGGGNATLIPLPGSTPIAASCATPPTGGFGVLYQSDPTIPINLGCPLTATPLNRAGAMQLFQFGFMVWIEGNPGTIWVFYADGIFTRYFDTFVEGVDPISGGETPPLNFYEPIRGFGKLWRTTPEVRSRLGWATMGIESPSPAITLDFERGLLLSLQPARGDILILTSANGNVSGVWRSVAGTP